MKVLVTGGTGTIGRAFIKKYIKEYEFFNISRNETTQNELKRDYPQVTNFVGSVEDGSFILSTFRKIKPDIVIHAAAMKYIDIAQLNPIQACKENIVGILNIIEASILNNVPVTIGISTDKACHPENVYGYTKSLMESCYMDANSGSIHFACARFANVAGSNGSVIPYWKSLRDRGEPLKLTHRRMTRLMFTIDDSVKLIKRSISECEKEGGFIISKIMKSVSMLKLAEVMSDEYVIVGLKPGEKLSETLISITELSYSYIEDEYIFIKKDINPNMETMLKYPLASDTADFMDEHELRELIKE